nr:MAG TPA: hypothetical protein [Caudoviricetes sp.]
MTQTISNDFRRFSDVNINVFFVYILLRDWLWIIQFNSFVFISQFPILPCLFT